ncbi:MAG: hypothetical protein MUF43_02895 [Flavobacterium sp.]|jgi:hypothetical protein|nr:hypothetical protein [Flavobacterium sp.]
MKLAYDFYKSLLLMNKNLTKENFLEKSGSQSGYSLNMFSRMYDSVSSELINVDLEYEKFYAFEYENIEQFLYRKYNIREKYIEELMKFRKDNPDCILYRKDDHSYGDYGIPQFMFSESMYDRIIEILTLKKQTNED